MRYTIIYLYIYTMITRVQLLVLAALLFCMRISAQPVITSTDMPVVDSVYHFHTPSILNVDFSLTGPDVTWDYTTLVETGFSRDSFANPGITPLVYQLIFNNFLYPSYDATHAQPGADLTLPSQIPFTVTNVYNFYKNSSTSFKMVGFGATINGIPAPIQYQGSDKIYSFPLAYGNMDTSTYYYEVPVPTLGYWNQTGTRYNHVDGFGTLLLPNGYSYDVIRLASRKEIVDSVHIDALGFTIPIPRIQTEYKFLAAGEKEPVMTITTQPLLLVFGPETVIGVKYKNEMNIAGIENETNKDFLVYPNPVSDKLTISNPQSYQWHTLYLTNIAGQVVYTDATGGNGNIQLDVSSLTKGTYRLIVNANGRAFKTSIIVQ